jgi:poly(3-hydroxybutyrate) depolymerase
MNALVGADPGDGQRHPAILWITGGFPPGGIDASAWSQPDVANEQTAQAYRHAGLVMMYPCFRGGCGNPGVQEDFYGEVDDVVSALAYLKTLSYVDPDRIYLGGHSTGATLALLAAAATDDFAAVFALGPLGDPAHYGSAAVHYDLLDDKEVELRAPNNFLHTIRTPTWVIEGDSGSSNVISFVAMDLWNTNDAVQFALVEGADHFSVLHPVNTAIAAALKTGPAGGDIVVDESVLQEAWNSRAR